MKRVVPYLVIIVFWAGLVVADTYRFTYQKTIDIDSDTELTITNTSGEIKVTGTPASSIVIDAVKHITASDEQEAEKLEEYLDIKVDKRGNHVNIVTTTAKEGQPDRSFWDRLLGRGSDPIGRVDYSVSVPFDCQVQLCNSSGDILVSDLNNDVYATGTSGAIMIERIRAPLVIEANSSSVTVKEVQGDIDISSTSSSITLESITGRTEVRATSGTMVGTYLDGPLKISKTSGAIKLAHLAGDLRVKSTSGGINVIQKIGGIDIQTHSGDVTIQTEMHSDLGYYVETASGDIIFKAPGGTSGTVNLQSLTGEINTELPVTIRSFSNNKLIGDFGSQGPKVSLSTESGDILLGQY